MNFCRRGVRSASLVVVLLVIAACAGPAEESQPPSGEMEGFFGHSDMVEEYRATIDGFELPEGAAVADSPSGYDETGSYQVGYGEVEAVMAWNCAWGQEWLAVRGVSEVDAAHALEMYASILETAAFERAFDDQSAKPVVRGIIEKARLGDASGVQQDVEANCPAS